MPSRAESVFDRASLVSSAQDVAHAQEVSCALLFGVLHGPLPDSMSVDPTRERGRRSASSPARIRELSVFLLSAAATATMLAAWSTSGCEGKNGPGALVGTGTRREICHGSRAERTPTRAGPGPAYAVVIGDDGGGIRIGDQALAATFLGLSQIGADRRPPGTTEASTSW